MQQNVAYKRTSSTKRRPNIFIYTAKRGTQANQFYKNKYKNDKSCAFKIVKGLKNENKDISSETSVVKSVFQMMGGFWHKITQTKLNLLRYIMSDSLTWSSSEKKEWISDNTDHKGPPIYIT